MQLKEKPLWLFLQRREVRESLLVFLCSIMKNGTFYFFKKWWLFQPFFVYLWHYLHKKLILEQVLLIFDWILYVLFAINVLYLLVYSLASLRRHPDKPVLAKEHKRFALLIAAYKEDTVIIDTVQACLAQDYPSDKYDVVVISDHMQPSTNE